MALFGFIERWKRQRRGLEALARLGKMEVGLIRAYDQLIKKVGHPGIADQLAQFRNDHAQHLFDLVAGRHMQRRLKGAREIALVRHSGFGGRIALTEDTESALAEALALEEVAWRNWAALSAQVPEELVPLVTRIRQDEPMHLRMVRSLLESRAWELEEIYPDGP